MTIMYHTKDGVELKEEEIKQGKDKAIGLYKVVEEYLQTKPDVYTLSYTLSTLPQFFKFLPS